MPAGRPRTPLAKAKATGRTTVNPGRYAGRNNQPDSRALGEPSRSLNQREREMWAAFKKEAWWLCECDRVLVEEGAKLRAKSASKAGLEVPERSQLISICKSLGMTPVDRSRVLVAPGAGADATDSADDFIN